MQWGNHTHVIDLYYHGSVNMEYDDAILNVVDLHQTFAGIALRSNSESRDHFYTLSDELARLSLADSDPYTMGYEFLTDVTHQSFCTSGLIFYPGLVSLGSIISFLHIWQGLLFVNDETTSQNYLSQSDIFCTIVYQCANLSLNMDSMSLRISEFILEESHEEEHFFTLLIYMITCSIFSILIIPIIIFQILLIREIHNFGVLLKNVDSQTKEGGANPIRKEHLEDIDDTVTFSETKSSHNFSFLSIALIIFFYVISGVSSMLTLILVLLIGEELESAEYFLSVNCPRTSYIAETLFHLFYGIVLTNTEVQYNFSDFQTEFDLVQLSLKSFDKSKEILSSGTEHTESIFGFDDYIDSLLITPEEPPPTQKTIFIKSMFPQA
jgi:hypothetical protein